MAMLNNQMVLPSTTAFQPSSRAVFFISRTHQALQDERQDAAGDA